MQTVVRKHIEHSTMAKLFYSIIITFLLFSCGQHVDKDYIETVKKGNVSTTTSRDTTKLAKLINIKTFRPVQVKFQYSFIDNSGQDQRINVPGPSDSHLEALLFFDTATFKELKSKYLAINHSSPNWDKAGFNFGWLDKDIRNELLKSGTNYHGHSDYFFELGHSGKLWLLDNKLLLIKSTN